MIKKLFKFLALSLAIFTLFTGTAHAEWWAKQSNGQLYTNGGNGLGNSIINVAGCNGCGGGGGGGVTSVGLTTGTAGTNVNVTGSPITGAGSFTLNIPTASGTNTGKLSSSDWTTFNNKVSTGLFTGSGLTMNTNRLLGRTTAGVGAAEEITVGSGLTFSGTNLAVDGSIVSGLLYKGTWNASTNTPTLASGVGTTGDLYIVSVAGTTTLDGISSWAVGDFLFFNGTIWQQIVGTNLTNIVDGTTPTTGFGADEILFSDGSVTRGNSKFTYNPTTNLFQVTDGADRFLRISPTAKTFGIGDMDGAGPYIESSLSGNLLQLVATNLEMGGNQYVFPAVQGTAGQVLAVDSVSLGTATLNWITPSSGNVTGTGANGRITYWTGTSTISGSNAFSWNDLTKTFQITNGAIPAKRAFIVDGLNFDVVSGDISDGGNSTSWGVFDSSQNIQALGGDGLGSTGAVLDIYTNLSAGQGAIVNMGDVSQLVNATVFSVNDQIQQIQAFGANYRGMKLDFASDILTFGDVGQSTSGTLNIGSIEIGSGGVFNMWGADVMGGLSPFFAALGGGDYAWGDLNGTNSGSILTFSDSSGGVWSFNQGSIQFNGIDYLFPASQGSTGQALVLQNNTGTLEYENVPRSLFQQTQSITIAATTTPTSVFGIGQGSLVIPANSAYAGATYEIDVYGYYQAASTQTLDYKIQMMGTNLAPAVTPTPFATAGTPFAFRAHFTITIRTTGVSGQGAIEGYIKFDKNDGNNLTFELNSTALQTIDTTVGHTTDLIMNWSSSSVTNSLTILRAEVNQTR